MPQPLRLGASPLLLALLSWLLLCPTRGKPKGKDSTVKQPTEKAAGPLASERNVHRDSNARSVLRQEMYTVFEADEVLPPVAIYRLIGNDMPPLQLVGQLRWNTQYALDYEPAFEGGRRRWILNRIWNATEFEALYTSLIAGGVHRRDILLRCFDLDVYSSLKEENERLLYLTSQNEGRNAGIIDGRESGFEWSMLLDGNTFITNDSWSKLRIVFREASLQGKWYVKIPYHRLHEEQKPSILNSSTLMKAILPEAPIKGESQIAFHKFAPELFTLGDTKPENSDKSKRRGYGQRNKSYMFKEGQICGRDSPICMCAEVPEGNEQDFFSKINHTYTIQKTDYANNCGLVLRLWNFPPENVIFTGLSPQNETGFFCYFDKIRPSIYAGVSPHRYFSECHAINIAIELWNNISAPERKPFQARSKICKENYHLTFLNSSCFRAEDRLVAQTVAYRSLKPLVQEFEAAKVKFNLTAANGSKLKEYNMQHNMCNRLRSKRKDDRRPHFLLSMSEQTLARERAEWISKYATRINKTIYGRPAKSKANAPLGDYISTLVTYAERSLLQGPFSVIRKRKTPPSTTDKKHYYSLQPSVWPVDEVPESVKLKLEDEMLRDGGATMDEKAKRLWKNGYYRYDGHHLPGSDIGEARCENYDRCAAWYMVDNVSTLALAWYFTNDTRYSEYGTKLLRTWFVNNVTYMYPKLNHAQNGARDGIMDWKDVYFLLDAVSLLGQSGSMPKWVEWSIERWCAKLADWCIHSQQGREEMTSLNHRGMYFDLTVLSLSAYSYEDDMADSARSRLFYRLSKPYPRGHFALDGSQPYELDRLDGAGNNMLHYVTYNLIGWIRAALAIDAISRNSEIPGVFPSLWNVRHEGFTPPVIEQIGISPSAVDTKAFFQERQRPKESGGDDGDKAQAQGQGPESLPVLLKALRWVAQFVPPLSGGGGKAKTQVLQLGPQTLAAGKDEAPFKFDRLVEVLQIGCQIYGFKLVFPKSSSSTTTSSSSTNAVAADKQQLKALLLSSPYQSFLGGASFSAYSSAVPDTGQRSWGALGQQKQQQPSGDGDSLGDAKDGR